MNSILSSILSTNALDALTSKTGLNAEDVQKVISSVAPKLLEKANDDFKAPHSSEGLINLIKKTDLNDNSNITDTDFGNNILGQLLGSKDQSRELASNVSQNTGVDVGAIKQLLPMIAPLVLGSLNKFIPSSNLQDSSSITSMLSSFIDKNNDGSVVDDLMNMAGNFFKKG